MRQFGRKFISLDKIQPIFALVRLKLVAEIKLRAFDRFQTNFGHFGGK
jgi:hypothetical protein